MLSFFAGFARWGVLIYLFLSSGCALSLLADPEGKKASLALGRCEFLWVQTGGFKKDILEVMLENVVSGRPYLAVTNTKGYYFLPNLPTGVYLLKRIKFSLQDVTVEHEPDTKLFVMFDPGKVYYLGKLIVEVNRSRLKRGLTYSAYEKHISGDIQEEDIKRLIAERKGGSKWLKQEIVLENPLERF